MDKLKNLERPYNIDSTVWGQTLSIGPVRNGIIMITASDFDCGQTVKIGLAVGDVDNIVDALRASLEIAGECEELRDAEAAARKVENAAAKAKKHEDRRYARLAAKEKHES